MCTANMSASRTRPRTTGQGMSVPTPSLTCKVGLCLGAAKMVGPGGWLANVHSPLPLPSASSNLEEACCPC